MKKWKSSPEKRTQVLCTFIKCLASLPLFEPENQESAEYQKFISGRDEIITWLFTQTADLTEQNAYDVLGTFPISYFTSETLPVYLREFVTENEQGEEIINFFPIVKNCRNLSVLTHFVQKMLEKEISALPRDIAHRAMKKVRQPWRNKEERNRLAKTRDLIIELQCRHKANPEMRSKLTLALISADVSFTSSTEALGQ